MSASIRHNSLTAEKCAFFLCDMQEKFIPVIENFNSILEVSRRLVNYLMILIIYKYFKWTCWLIKVEGSKILGLTLIVTEQYPKGLGPTVSVLDISQADLKIEKTKFTMFNQEVDKMLKSKGVEVVVLFGVEVRLNLIRVN